MNTNPGRAKKLSKARSKSAGSKSTTSTKDDFTHPLLGTFELFDTVYCLLRRRGISCNFVTIEALASKLAQGNQKFSLDAVRKMVTVVPALLQLQYTPVIRTGLRAPESAAVSHDQNESSGLSVIRTSVPTTQPCQVSENVDHYLEIKVLGKKLGVGAAHKNQRRNQFVKALKNMNGAEIEMCELPKPPGTARSEMSKLYQNQGGFLPQYSNNNNSQDSESDSHQTGNFQSNSLVSSDQGLHQKLDSLEIRDSTGSIDPLRVLEVLKYTTNYKNQVEFVREIGAKPAKFGSLDRPLVPQLQQALENYGIKKFFSHQTKGINAARAGKDVVISTSTSSGKSMVYNVPVLESILTSHQQYSSAITCTDMPDASRRATALYIFPTKALSQDQSIAIQKLAKSLQLPTSVASASDTDPYNLQDTSQEIHVNTCDGDTAQDEREAVRESSHIIITNPDMLHVTILPQHSKWSHFLSSLRYVVIDEAHVYSGAFGSHVGCVMRRLLRVCALYSSQRPQFICCSATIANPLNVFRLLVPSKSTNSICVVSEEEDGSPSSHSVFAVWNPPIRASASDGASTEVLLPKVKVEDVLDLPVECRDVCEDPQVFARVSSVLKQVEKLGEQNRTDVAAFSSFGDEISHPRVENQNAQSAMGTIHNGLHESSTNQSLRVNDVQIHNDSFQTSTTGSSHHNPFQNSTVSFANSAPQTTEFSNTKTQQEMKPIVHDSKQGIKQHENVEDAMGTKRFSSIFETAMVLAALVRLGVKTLAFCRTRKLVELVLKYAKAELKGGSGNGLLNDSSNKSNEDNVTTAVSCEEVGSDPLKSIVREIMREPNSKLVNKVAGYRGGYTKNERRKVERQLFSGELIGVTATCALELGVDIGCLDAVVVLGFPGSVASLWQQIGRAGRSARRSLAIMIPFNGPVDQYMASNPEMLLNRNSLENTVLDPCNPLIMRGHLMCAASETPLELCVGHKCNPCKLLQEEAKVVAPDMLASVPRCCVSAVLCDRKWGADYMSDIELFSSIHNPKVTEERTRGLIVELTNDKLTQMLPIRKAVQIWVGNRVPPFPVDQSRCRCSAHVLHPKVCHVARTVSLRTIDPVTFKLVNDCIQTVPGSNNNLLDTVPYRRAFFCLYPGAIYMHQGTSYLVTRLDLKDHIAHCIPTSVDYYTAPRDIVDINVVSRFETRWGAVSTFPVQCNARDEVSSSTASQNNSAVIVHTGVVEVEAKVWGYRKMRLRTGRVFEMHEFTLPPLVYQTRGMWLNIPEVVQRSVKSAGYSLWDGIHAAGHVLARLIPRIAVCDNDEVGVEHGSVHSQRIRPARVMVYDTTPGGTGVAEAAFRSIGKLIAMSIDLIKNCPCDAGCTKCVWSLKCSAHNLVLSKAAGLLVLQGLILETTAGSIENNTDVEDSVLKIETVRDDELTKNEHYARSGYLFDSSLVLPTPVLNNGAADSSVPNSPIRKKARLGNDTEVPSPVKRRKQAMGRAKGLGKGRNKHIFIRGSHLWGKHNLAHSEWMDM